jgi:hypothetical protein
MNERPRGRGVGEDCALRLLPLALFLKPQRHNDFLRRREGQTTHYGLRKILRCAASKTTLFEDDDPPSNPPPPLSPQRDTATSPSRAAAIISRIGNAVAGVIGLPPPPPLPPCRRHSSATAAAAAAAAALLPPPPHVSIHKLRTVAPRYGELLAYWFILHGCST